MIIVNTNKSAKDLGIPAEFNLKTLDVSQIAMKTLGSQPR